MSAPIREAGTSVAVVGGGLAGPAAVVGLCGLGLRVELFEARRRLGGRAGSFRDPASGEWLDHCQHVALGCCTNLADFCRRTALADCFRRQPAVHFIAPNGTRYDLAAFPLLPAPLDLAPGLLRLGYLRLRDRLRIAHTMLRLARLPDQEAACDRSVGDWLRGQGESEEAIERFWSVVLLSALSETVDRASLAAARKVFVDGFLASRRAHELVVPRVTLGEIYDRRLSAWLSAQGVAVHRGERIAQIDGSPERAEALVLADGSRREFDLFVVAVPWRRVQGLFSPAIKAAMPALENLRRIEPAAITAVHLWYDRPITALGNAALVGRLSQWVFHRPTEPDPPPVRRGSPLVRRGSPDPAEMADRQVSADLETFGRARGSVGRPATTGGRSAATGGKPAATDAGHYYQVVISASHELAGRGREELAKTVRDELAAVWPAARDAQLVRFRVVTEPEAVFSVRPDVDRFRPGQRTPIANLALAGDWTNTGWPATMEGAVRSGYLAAEVIREAIGAEKRLLVPDLPRGLLARLLLR